MKRQNLIHILLGIVCIGLLPDAQAVLPPPDGGYPGGNTAEGQNALLSLNVNMGTNNTAVGWFSLKSNVEGQFNTAVGAGTLFNNTAHRNTAIGGAAMFSNTVGSFNTAVGMLSLFTNSTGTSNTAIGDGALGSNTDEHFNTAVGANALSNSNERSNTGIGSSALRNTTTGGFNTAVGAAALFNNTTGYNNLAVGVGAGTNVTTSHDVICIGNDVDGQNISTSCYIGNIFGQTSAGGIPVIVNSNDKLGTTTSSKRFKEEIKPMGKASEDILALKPVTFRYKKDIDPAGTPQLGLVAEDVEKVNPNLVVRDKEGKAYTVRYDSVNAMLLNEFLKEHRKVEALQASSARQEKDFQATVAQQQKQIDALTAGLQKVSAQLETTKLARQVVNNP